MGVPSSAIGSFIIGASPIGGSSTTSGTSDFNPSFTFIATSALRKIGALGDSEVPTAGMYSDTAFAAQALVKEWQALGIHVWTEEEAVLFLQPGQVRYALGSPSLDNATDADSYVQTTLSTAAATGATSVSVSTILGLVDGQNIGIVLSAGPTFWTTISGVPSGTTVNLAAALPADAASGNSVYAYTTRIVRPLRVPFARRRLLTPGNAQNIDTPMIVLSRQEYEDLPNKTTSGIPTQMFYSPQLGQGQMRVWPAPPDSSSAIAFTWYRPIQDITAPSQTADLPQEWINAIIWNLAKEIGLDYDVPPQRWQIILAMAAEKLDVVQSWDREPEPVEFQMDYGGFRR